MAQEFDIFASHSICLWLISRPSGEAGVLFDDKFNDKLSAKSDRGFLTLAFPVPALLVAAGAALGQLWLLGAAFAVQHAGLIAACWFFFVQANHPQNLYYQAIA